MLKFSKLSALPIIFLMIVYSCSKIHPSDELLEGTSGSNAVHTYPLVFKGSLGGYDHTDTKSSAYNWKNGEKIYITFYKDSIEKAGVNGIATYADTTGWTLTCEGTLPTGTGIRCDAIYFDSAASALNTVVHITPYTAIYETDEGTYDFIDSKLSVTAQLKPKTGRIKFNGTVSQRINVTGITCYSIYSPDNGYISSSTAVISDTVTSEGSTRYIYGFFADTTRRIAMMGTDFAFTRDCSEEVLKTGSSGYMTIPTETSHNDWRTGLYVTAYGVEFKMIPVTGHTSGTFFIGETEVTRELYYKVNNKSSTYSISYPNRPAADITHSVMESWIKILNTATALNFSLPSKSQWTYAAQGGKYSLGFTYSGSNNPEEVAWYSDNASSAQDVKQKAPNELGIYDMSGNVWEAVSDYYKSSSYTYYYWGGGAYNTSCSYLYPTEFNAYTTSISSTDKGFRLCLTME